MPGKSSQRKGADGERELAALLREYGYPVERGGSLSFGEVPDLTGLPGVHIEVKRVERLNVPKAMKQAVRDAEKFHDGAPTLFHRRSREPWLVTMRLHDWIALYDRQKTTETTREGGDTHDTAQRKSPASPSCEPYKGRGSKGRRDW